MSNEITVTEVENSLTSWFSDHLGFYHIMDPDVIENLVLPPRVDPQLVQDDRLMLEKKNNTMTQGELDQLKRVVSLLKWS